MGFAQRAGKVLAGDYAVEKAIKTGRAKLVLLDASASENTGARYEGLCQRAELPLVRVEDMGAAIGRYGRKIAAVTDEGFARMIWENSHGGTSEWQK